MARPKSLRPKYCRHKSTGRAFVVLSGEFVYLGKFNSQASHDAYDMAIADWIGRGRCHVIPPAATYATDRPYRMMELIDAYWTHAQAYYVDPDGKPTSEVDTVRQALRPLKALFGNLPAEEFKPMKLKALREHMIGLNWSRNHINKQISRIKSMFMWGVGEELIKAETHHALTSVKGIKAGRTKAKETDPIKPVPLAHVEVILPFLSRQLSALVRLQLLTGSRGGELCVMRTGDIDRSGDIWNYTPRRHKTAHHGHARVIRIGPKGREILMPLLKLDPDAFIFNPADAERERREKLRQAREENENGTPLSCGNNPGDNVKENPDRKPGGRYTKDSYARAVARACDAAFPPPAELARRRVPARGRKVDATRWETDAEWIARLGDKAKDLKAWQDDHRFHPHQLRHSAATFIANAEGIEVARIILGHRHIKTTTLYAEADQQRAAEIMRKIG